MLKCHNNQFYWRNEQDWNGLEWVRMNRNELEWVGMTWNGCNDIKADFDRNFNRIGMGWNELE